MPPGLFLEHHRSRFRPSDPPDPVPFRLLLLFLQSGYDFTWDCGVLPSPFSARHDDIIGAVIFIFYDVETLPVCLQAVFILLS